MFGYLPSGCSISIDAGQPSPQPVLEKIFFYKKKISQSPVLDTANTNMFSFDILSSVEIIIIIIFRAIFFQGVDIRYEIPVLLTGISKHSSTHFIPSEWM